MDEQIKNKPDWKVAVSALALLVSGVSLYFSLQRTQIDSQTAVNTKNIQTIVDFINQSIAQSQIKK